MAEGVGPRRGRRAETTAESHPAPERVQTGEDAVDGWAPTDRCGYEWDPEWLTHRDKNQHCCVRSAWPTSERGRCWWHMDGPKSLEDFLTEDEIDPEEGDAAEPRVVLDAGRVERELLGNRRHNATDLRGPVRAYAPGDGEAEREAGTGTETETETEPNPDREGYGEDIEPTELSSRDSVRIPTIAPETEDGVAVSDHPAELLCGVTLESVRLGDSFPLTNCWINDADLSRVNLEGAAMEGVDLERVTAADAVLRRATLRGADLRGDFEGAHMDGVDLTGADVSEVGYEYAALPRPSLRAASLAGATLRGTDLGRADLTDADLSGATLRRADLERATLTRANLFDAELQNARLYGVVLTEAQTNDDTALLTTVDDRDGPLARLIELLSASRRYDLETGGDGSSPTPDDATADDRWLRLLGGVRPVADVLDTAVRLLLLPLVVARGLLPLEGGGETRFVSAYDPTNEGSPLDDVVAPGRGTGAENVDGDDDGDEGPGEEYVDRLTKAAGTYRKLETLANENSFTGVQRAMFLRRKTTERRKRLVTDGAADLGHVGAFLSGLVYRYGEGYARVLGWCIVFVLAFALVFPLGGWIRPVGPGARVPRISYDSILADPTLLWDSVYYSTLTFTNLGFGDYRPAGRYGQLLTVVETAIGVVMLSLLVFVLGRRASR